MKLYKLSLKEDASSYAVVRAENEGIARKLAKSAGLVSSASKIHSKHDDTPLTDEAVNCCECYDSKYTTDGESEVLYIVPHIKI